MSKYLHARLFVHMYVYESLCLLLLYPKRCIHSSLPLGILLYTTMRMNMFDVMYSHPLESLLNACYFFLLCFFLVTLYCTTKYERMNIKKMKMKRYEIKFLIFMCKH